LADVIPPEFQEGQDEVYRMETDAQGVTTYILAAQEVSVRMGQPRPSPDHRIRHKNGDFLDNRRPNLEWHVPPIGPNPSKN
jgi:hypothetical protein